MVNKVSLCSVIEILIVTVKTIQEICHIDNFDCGLILKRLMDQIEERILQTDELKTLENVCNIASIYHIHRDSHKNM